MARRQRFTREELEQYFDRVCIPKSRRKYDAQALDDEQQLEFLRLLQKHHLCKCPWENLVQHYSWHHTVHLKPAHLFQKIVLQPGRGGYCFENNFFYHLVLYSLGFNVYMAGSRIFRADEGKYGGWTHIVNIAAIAGTKYLLDSGFGGQGPPGPMPLAHGTELPHIHPAEMRLMHELIPNNVDLSQKVWVYQYRYDENAEWKPMYCFVDFEFTPEDVGSMNFAPSLSRHTFFTHKVACVRYTTDLETDSPGSPGEHELSGKIDGFLTLYHDTLKWRRHGQKVVESTFKKEAERVAALKKYFGIDLSEDDRESILNTAAMIEVKPTGAED